MSASFGKTINYGPGINGYIDSLNISPFLILCHSFVEIRVHTFLENGDFFQLYESSDMFLNLCYEYDAVPSNSQQTKP